MRNGFALSLSACLLMASPAMAHDTFPAHWCPAGSTVNIVKHFDLTPQALANYRALHLDDDDVLGSDCGELRTCGIVDDWFWANEAAIESCNVNPLRSTALTTTASSSPSPPTSASAMPFVSLPETFNLDGDADHNGIKDHHDLYSFRSGLRGVCVVCTSPGPVPAPPAPAPKDIEHVR